jgi:hypothetical protein
MRVEGLEAAHAVPGIRHVRAFGEGDLRAARLAHRECQVDDAVARALRQVERRRLVGMAGHGEGGAVLHDAGGGRNRELPRRQQVTVER